MSVIGGLKKKCPAALTVNRVQPTWKGLQTQMVFQNQIQFVSLLITGKLTTEISFSSNCKNLESECKVSQCNVETIEIKICQHELKDNFLTIVCDWSVK